MSISVPKQGGWTFKVQDVPGNGNCMFESVGRTAGIPAPELRRQVVTWMKQPNRKLHDVNLSDWIEWNTGKTLPHYVSQMSRNGEWGTGIELATMATILNCAIVVYGRDGAGMAKRLAEFLPSSAPNPAELPAICVLYVNNNHYMQLIPIVPKTTA